MNPRSGTRRAAFACAALLLPAGAARAATLQTLQPLDEPPTLTHHLVEFHPYLGVSESYDSNIFLHKHAVPSWITTEDLGLRVPAASPSERHHLLLDYDGAHRDYSYSKSSDVKDAWIQDAQGRYWYKSPWGGTLRARELFLSTIDPANSELTGLRRRWQNTAGGELGYEPEERSISVRGGFEETRQKYAGGDPLLDRYAQVVGGRVGFQVQPKTVAYAAYHRQITHFTDNPNPSRDSKDHLVDFGVEGELAPKTTGRAQVGFVSRRYDSQPAPGQDRETTNLTALVAVAWLPDDRSRLDLTLRRALEESEYDVNQFYISNGALVEASHEFLWKLKVNLSAGAEQDKYPATSVVGPAVNRRDDVYQAGAGLEYPLRDWLKAGASYVYRARFSRDLSEQFNYRDDVTTVDLTAAF